MINKSKNGLYIHIPYCKQKCLYCSFYSIPNNKVDNEYIDALLKEILTYKTYSYTIDTIFIGGGTPSLLTEDQFERLFGTIHDSFNLDLEEVTVEMNPDSITESKLVILKECGVNRLSIGVQSFNDDELKAIGRIHNSRRAVDAIMLANKYFDNINIDLMIGLPHQTLDSIHNNLSILSKLDIQHVSVYSLILEEGTPLYNRVCNGLNLPDDDETVEWYDEVVAYLSKLGFERYEISNFAIDGYRCKHNLHCWQYKDYIGIGPSASSFLNGRRFTNQPDLCGYITNGASLIIEDCDEPHKEYIMLALRTKEGIDKIYFNQRFGHNFDDLYKDIIDNKVIKSSCVNTPDRFYIKPECIYISNSIIVEFF